MQQLLDKLERLRKSEYLRPDEKLMLNHCISDLKRFMDHSGEVTEMVGKRTVVEWLINQLQQTRDFQRVINEANENSSSVRDVIKEAKELEKEQKIKNITDYNIKVTEFLLNQLFNLEHSKHRIACEKLSDIRNQFIYDNIVNYNETYGGNK